MSNNLPAVPQAQNSVLKILESAVAVAELRKVCAANLSPERLLRMIISTAKSKIDVQQCSPTSVMRCAMQLGQLGLEPDGRHAHLIPYKGELTLLIDWKGLVLLGRRNGVKGIVSEVVYANDTFAMMRDEKGLHFRHEPEIRGERGEPLGAYCSFTIDDTPELEYMSYDDIESARSKSRNADGSFWRDHWGEMARKTTIRRASKRWPLDAEIADAMQADNDDRTTVTAEPAAKATTVAPATAALFSRPTQALNPAQAPAATAAAAPQPEKAANVEAVETVAPAPTPSAPVTQTVKRGPGRPRAASMSPTTPPAAAAPVPEPVIVPAPKPVAPLVPEPVTKATSPSGLPVHLEVLDLRLKGKNIPREALVEAMIAGGLCSENTRFDFLAEDEVTHITDEQLDALAESLTPADDVAS